MSGERSNVFKFRELTSEMQEVPPTAFIAKISRALLSGRVLSASKEPIPAELLLAQQLPVCNSFPPGGMVMASPDPQIIPTDIAPIIPSSPVRKLEDPVPVVFEIAFLGIILLLSCVSLGLKEWTTHCSTSVGLEKVSGGSLSDLEDFICSHPSPAAYVCAFSCSNIELLRQAGQVMLALGILSIILTVLILVRLGLLFLLYFVLLRGLIVKIAIWVAAGLWIVGTVVYFFLFLSVRIDTSEVELKGGLGLAIAVGVLHAGSCVLGPITLAHVK